MLNKILKINNSDNVITALSDLKKGEEVQWNGNLFLIKDNIAAKHKFFEKDMQAAEEIIMYGVLVGKTQVAVNAGSLMTT
ncbi:MAG TPA: UxaA family hydrolase, partial [Ferruginibacter sp.]|nr:UxaA family hydrolase [Ferruginibacter sp.]